jgi:hypothetical protein
MSSVYSQIWLSFVKIVCLVCICIVCSRLAIKEGIHILLWLRQLIRFEPFSWVSTFTCAMTRCISTFWLYSAFCTISCDVTVTATFITFYWGVRLCFSRRDMGTKKLLAHLTGHLWGRDLLGSWFLACATVLAILNASSGVLGIAKRVCLPGVPVRPAMKDANSIILYCSLYDFRLNTKHKM